MTPYVSLPPSVTNILLISLREHMQMLGVAVFAGYYKEINDDKLVFERLDIEKMS